MLKNLFIVCLLGMMTACTSGNARMTSLSELSSHASKSVLNTTGKRAAIETLGCKATTPGMKFVDSIPLMTTTVHKVSSMLTGKGYTIVDKAQISAEDLLVEVKIQCTNGDLNLLVYFVSLGILPSWGSQHLTIDITLKSGNGGLLARYRTAGESTAYLTALSPVALFMGNNGRVEVGNHISKLLQTQVH